MTDSIIEWVIKQHEAGWNPVPWNTRENEPVLKEYIPYRETPPTMAQIDEWMPSFEKYGVAQITGLCHRGKFRGLYLNCVDFDNPEILSKLLEMYSLEALINAGMFIEQHYDNKDKAHLWILSTKPFPKFKSLGLEVKSQGMLCNSFPSFNKGGYRYFPVGNSLKIFDDSIDAQTNDGFIKVIDKLVDGQYLNGKANGYNSVEKNQQKIPNGQRHARLLSYANSLIARLHKTTNKETIRKMFETYNQEECEPPLGYEGAKKHEELRELKQIFDDAWNNIALVKSDNNSNYQQQKQKESTVEFELISVSEALRRNSGKFGVSGMITSMSKLYKMIKKYKLYCNACASNQDILCVRPKTEIRKQDCICKQCSTPEKVIYGTVPDVDINYTSVVNVELQDTESFNDIDRLSCMLFDKNTENISVGERVTVLGDIVVIHKNGKEDSRTKMFPFLFSESIKYENKAIVELSDLDIAAIKRFCARGSVIDNLVQLFDPLIIGYEHVKKGLLLIAVNTGYEYQNYLNHMTNAERHRLNAVLIGDPGLAKSRLLKSAVRLVPNSRYESGENSSVLSLTAIVSKEEENYVLRLGPASLAKGAICAINEFGRMNIEDQSHLHSIMEEGDYTINKHGINARIVSPTTVLASANPIGTEWMYKDKIDNSDFPALGPIIDRFDLKFIFRKYTDKEEIRKYALKKAEIADKKQPDYIPFLVKYIEYARRLNPTITDEAKYMLVEFFTNLSHKGFGTNRVLETLFRLSKATARLKLKEIVESDDARETIEFYNVMLQNYQQTTTVPTEPRDLTIMECTKVLQEKESGITLDELIKEVCENNEYVSRYLGFGHRSLQSRDNKKVKVVYEMLIKNPNITRTNYRPIVLEWVKSERSDPSDLCDLEKIGEDKKIDEDMPRCEPEKNSPLSFSGSLGSHRSLQSEYQCYYCIENFESKNDYQKHVVNTHPKKLCYPGKADIQYYKLKPQGRSWEVG